MTEGDVPQEIGREELIAIRRAHANEALARAVLKDTPDQIGQWRTLPDSREYARRGHVWELLAWYHHNVAREEFGGFRKLLKRLWYRLRGKRTELMSPWEQLRHRTELEAVIEVNEAHAEGRLIVNPETGAYRIRPKRGE